MDTPSSFFDAFTKAPNKMDFLNSLREPPLDRMQPWHQCIPETRGDERLRRWRQKQVWARALAKYSSEKGGVIIWGMNFETTDKYGGSTAVFGGHVAVEDAAELRDRLLRMVDEVVDPPLAGVAIEIVEPWGNKKGFVVCYIPPSHAPVTMTADTMWLPPRAGESDFHSFRSDTSFVLIGSNGSGKSRLGVWIDQLPGDGAFVHRISAHRALEIAASIEMLPVVRAHRMLTIGLDTPGAYDQKKSERWRNNPISHVSNDFSAVLAWLFAEQGEVATRFWKASLDQSRPDRPPSQLEIASEIWRSVMPHIDLIASPDEGRVEAKSSGGRYHGKEMSDGERVTLYLIGQCLAVPRGGIIVIDEPELHLHQSIQSALWDAVERARPDCVFVYITHDLKFAASRRKAKKIWVKKYDGMNWDWEPVKPADPFPESLVLQLLGTRQKVLFVESEADAAIYQVLFSDRLVVPRGGCSAVIDSTASLNALPQFHHTSSIGLIDRDRRSDDEIASYGNKQVYAPAVAELENLFLVPEVIEIIAERLVKDKTQILKDVQDEAFKQLRCDMKVQINERAVFQIQQILGGYGGLTDNSADKGRFSVEVNTFLSQINPADVYQECEKLFIDIVDSKDYKRLLRYFNRKSLVKQLSPRIGLTGKEYCELVERLLSSKEGEPLRQAMLKYISIK